jgi:hypothetical protein
MFGSPLEHAAVPWFPKIMSKQVVSLIFLLILPMYAYSLTLTEKLREAAPGDYLVTNQDRTLTLLLIAERNDERIVLQEISAPETRRCTNWAQWLAAKAPGHTAWNGYLISLETGRIERAYSYSKQGWLDLRGCDHFFSTLLRLPLTPVAEAERRRVGRPGRSGSDQRPVWQPALVFEGQRVSGARFDAYSACWPRDGTPIAGREIILYLPAERGSYPRYFPYWTDIKGTLKEFHLRVVDSGRGLSSPKPSLLTSR